MKNFFSNKSKYWLLLFLFSSQVSAQVTRQPYLQIITPTSVVVRWQTGTGVIGIVRYDTSIALLKEKINESKEERIYHEVKISGLLPNTKYFYSVDSSSKGNSEQYFITSPPAGSIKSTRIWVIADFGQTNSDQNERRIETVNQWKSFNNNNYHADFILSLGDQTEDDAIYQLQHNYFSQLENVLKNSSLFTVIGNHDYHDSVCNYLRTFTLPSNAEAGGFPSNTEKYYSFNYANIHIVVLCTEIEDKKGFAKQVDWLKKDLADNKQDWLIVCMHRPIHSAGYHKTDNDENAKLRKTEWLPILEDYGVDLILAGHNHVYERSYLIDNLTGNSASIQKDNKIDTGLGQIEKGGAYQKKFAQSHQGTIFLNCPAGGNSNSAKYLTDPFSFMPVEYAGSDFEGTVVIDVSVNRMDVKFLCDEKNEEGSHVWDYFTIIKKNEQL